MLLERKTDELGALQNENQDEFDAVIKQAVFKSYLGKFRGKMETYNVS